MSARAKFAGFLLLLAGLFGGAYAAGSHLGPLARTQSQTGGAGGSGTMHMGGQAAPARLQGGGP